MGKTKKYYVVWEGYEPGIYSDWNTCKRQIDGFAYAKYKSFASLAEAEKAFEDDPKKYIGKNVKSSGLSAEEKARYGEPILHSISVDGAWNTKTGFCEYQGRETSTGALLFHKGPFADGTNNVMEFLAIVHALAMCKQQGWQFPIYSDSRNAIAWVKQKRIGTKLQRSGNNDIIFDLMDRALAWLKQNTYSNAILKWETKAWGENPADFGRK